MSQFDFGNLESPLSGSNFINANLEPWRDALHTLHKGPSTPSYAVAGMMWIDDSASPWVLNIFDGTDNISVGTVDPTTNTFTPSGVSQEAENISFDNTDSGLAATNVQAAIDETVSDLSDFENRADGFATSAQGALADTALQPGQGGGSYLGTQTITSTGTYTPTTGMKFCRVRLTGSGQTVPNTGSTITNSSSGATCIKWYTAADIGASVSVTIGQPGAASIGFNVKAGDSTFKSMTAGGGYSAAGGGERTDTANSTATGGDINIPGTNGLVTSTSKISLPMSYWNFGNIAAYVANSVTNLPGCGAGGGPSSSNIFGKAGVCVIEEFG